MFEEGSSEHHTHSSAAEWSETLSGWRLTLWCHAAQRKVWMEVNISDRQAGVMRISLYIFYNFIFCFTTPSARLSWIYCIYHTLVHPLPSLPLLSVHPSFWPSYVRKDCLRGEHTIPVQCCGVVEEGQGAETWLVGVEWKSWLVSGVRTIISEYGVKALINECGVRAMISEYGVRAMTSECGV